MFFFCKEGSPNRGPTMMESWEELQNRKVAYDYEHLVGTFVHET